VKRDEGERMPAFLPVKLRQDSSSVLLVIDVVEDEDRL
jgi:hypothetical protein